MPKLGHSVLDQITGFKGIVIGHVEYITGCNQSLVQPPVKPDGDYVESRWFDDDRLSVDTSHPVVELSVTNAGYDKPAPRK